MSKLEREKDASAPETAACETPDGADELYEPVQPRTATGKAPVLVEIICERVHCVLYDYAINTVDLIVDIFGDKVEIQTVIRQGDIENAKRFMSLCERAGKMLTVPTILINGEVAFTSVPHPSELEKSIEAVLGILKK